MTPDSPRTVLLLGGKLGDPDEGRMPEDDRFEVFSDDEADIRIEEAILSLARATFVRGWRLAFQHDSVVTPLVLEVALEYWQSLPGEESGREGRRFSVEPVLILGGELTEEEREVIDYALKIGCAKFVRESRLTDVAVSRVVCIGGSTDVGDYVGWLNENASNVPIFTIPSTGGAALDLQAQVGIADLERDITETIVSRRSEMHFDPPQPETLAERPPRSLQQLDLESEPVPEFRYALYPLVMNAILDSEWGDNPTAVG